MRRTLILAAFALASIAALGAAHRPAQADVFISLPHLGLFIGDGHDHGYGYRDYDRRYYGHRDRYYAPRRYAPRRDRRYYGPPPRHGLGRWRAPRHYDRRAYDRRGHGRPWRGDRRRW